MRKLAVILIAAALLLGTSALFAQKKKQQGKGTVATSAQPPETAAADNYVIGPEDSVNITVWKEAELSGTVPVRPDGKISLALLGDVQAAGMTPMELTKQLTTQLKKYLEDPRVTVTVTGINSRRIYIVGQVGRAGAYPLLPGMTILQALSTAGGPSPYASADKIYVLRNENETSVKLAFQYKQVIKGRKQEQNILLKPGDTIVVP